MSIALPRAQKLTLYLSITIAVSALWISDAMDWTLLCAAAVLIPLSWVWRPALSARASTLWNTLLLLFIALSVLRVVVAPEQATNAAVQLVLTLVCTKLFQRQRARDDTHLHALGFLMMALAAALDHDLALGLVFILYMLVISLSLSLTHLRQATEADPDAEVVAQPPEPLVLGRGYWLLTSALAVVMLALTALGFFLLPRTHAARPADSAAQAGRTGLSDRVDLGRSGRLAYDDRVVMRIELQEPLAAPYWRALTLDTFDGTRWWASPRLAARWMPPPDPIPGHFSLSAPTDEAPLITQHIELEPLTHDALIALANPRTLQFAASTDDDNAPHPHWVQIDAGNSIYQNLEPEGALRYTVTSQPSALSPKTLSAAERQAYLQLPPDLSPRLRALTAGLIRHIEDPQARAQAIFEYVIRNHTYTLDLPERSGDPIDHFLFEAPEGHCEFFASTMVVLLRQAGVPAREVLGFMGGEWNTFGGYYTVRQRDAHAWVEAHIPGQGWVMFDPTPAASRPDQRNIPAQGSWGSALSDHLQRLWGRWIVEFSLERQLGLLKSFVLGDESQFDLGAFAGRLWIWLKANAAAGSMVGLFLVLWGYGVRRRRWRGRHLWGAWAVGGAVVWGVAPAGGVVWWIVVFAGPSIILWRLRLLEVTPQGSFIGATKPTDRSRLESFYDRLVEALRKDLRVPSEVLSLPPEALAQTLETSTDPARHEAASFVRLYTTLRFGPATATPSEQRATLQRAWKHFQKTARSR